MLRNVSFRAKDECCGDSVECSQQPEFRDLNSDLYFVVRYRFFTSRTKSIFSQELCHGKFFIGLFIGQELLES